MVAVLGVIVYTERVNTSATVMVWLLKHDVSAGQRYSAADVDHVEVRAQSSDFNYESLGPDAVQARYARGLAAHDILRQDDLIPDSAVAEVAIAVQNPPPINSGDRIDVYAMFSPRQQALIGRDLVVGSVAAGSITILVPVRDEPAWVAVSSSSVSLHVARTTGAAGVSRALSVDDAIRVLCGDACAAQPAVAPTASP
jgi:hypothetical protein